MRKNCIMSLFAMLLTVITLSAQNNTYTMVIEMKNGTKVNIGPNEVKNISFNNGQVVFSGNTIAEINADISSLWSELETLRKKVQKLAGEPETQEKVYYGWAGESITSVSGLQSVSKSSAAGYYNSTNNDWGYWWLVIPASWNLITIKSSGIGVLYEEAGTITVGSISYKKYRTSNELGAHEWVFEVI